MTLHGQGTAVIQAFQVGAQSQCPELASRFEDFTSRGGPQGVGVVDGGSAVIDRNIIEFAD